MQMAAIAIPGKSFLQMDVSTEKAQIRRTWEFNQGSISLAESKPQAAERGEQTTDEKQSQTSDAETTDTGNDSRRSSESSKKPIKPFKPSEEIAAEQAVDFPVDI
jgi:hypothetical protein